MITDNSQAADPGQFKAMVQQYADELMTYTKTQKGNTVTYTTMCNSSAVFDAFNLTGDEQTEAEQMTQNLEDYLKN